VDELRNDGPTHEEVERARAYAAGRTVLAFENSGAVARTAASQAIVFGDEINPDAIVAALDAVTYEDVLEVAHAVQDRLAVACVGPHRADEF
jgi:predicted Zn-dependent peptidase